MSNALQEREQQFEEVRNIILLHRTKALQNVNEESLLMSWEVGKLVSRHLKSNEWGSKVVTQLSEFLRTKDPSLKGYGRRNLYNMVKFYEAYSSAPFVTRIASLSLPAFVQTESAQTSQEIVQTPSAQLLCHSVICN